MDLSQSHEWTYDCVILALDQPADLLVAQKLQKEIQTYKLPRTKSRDSGHPTFHNIWVHIIKESEILTEETLSKLSSTRWVVLVCSRLTKDSKRVTDLLEYYYSLGRKENTLPLLIEGDPQKSFPGLFFEERETILPDDNGHEQRIVEIVEPLAVDIRSDRLKNTINLLSHAKVKVIAALLGVSYDTLEQRHYKRARQRFMLIGALLLIIPVALFSLFTFLWLNAQKQIEIANHKTEIAKDLFMHVCSTYPERFSIIPEAMPMVDSLLLENLIRLKTAESLFIKDLEIETLLKAQETDDYRALVSKAMLLRYIGKKEEALSTYSLAANQMENGAVYQVSSEVFVSLLDPMQYPSGVCVTAITPEISRRCDGLSVADIIISLDGFKFRSFVQYEITRDALKPDKPVKMEIIRPVDGKLEFHELTIKSLDLQFQAAEM